MGNTGYDWWGTSSPEKEKYRRELVKMTSGGYPKDVDVEFLRGLTAGTPTEVVTSPTDEDVEGAKAAVTREGMHFPDLSGKDLTVVRDVLGKVVAAVVTVDRGDDVLLYTVAVEPWRRREGLARTLMESVKERYPGKDIVGHVRTWREPAIKLYLSSGAEIGEKVEGYYSNGDDAYEVVYRGDTDV